MNRIENILQHSKYILILLLLQFLSALDNRDNSWMLSDDSEIAEIHITIDPGALEWIYANVESDSMHLAYLSGDADLDVLDIVMLVDIIMS